MHSSTIIFRMRRTTGKPGIEHGNILGGGLSSTIPTGAAGNDRPITITDEYWYSDELHMNITLKHTDPRQGTQFVILTQLSRGEPDEKMFEIPAEYKTLQ